ncbi:MAG: hypothetical protein D6712_04810 [Chloroflexi bacterium]|nr:MAG: hypothetical protein D6712_04810 [Chloroflexota bacterium]
MFKNVSSKFFFLVGLMVLLIMPTVSVSAKASLDCGDGTILDNAVLLTLTPIANGDTIGITVLGINGFDPVVGVVTPQGTFCNDDKPTFTGIRTNLPTTAQVDEQTTSAQVIYTNTTGSSASVDIFIADYQQRYGQFLLLIDGLDTTDVSTNPQPATRYQVIGITLDEQIVSSSIPITAYQIGVSDNMDPFIRAVQYPSQTLISECDDSSPTSCSNLGSLSGFYVADSSGNIVAGDGLDAALQYTPARIDIGNNRATFRFMSVNNNDGPYMIALHMGFAEGGQQQQVPNNGAQNNPTQPPSNGGGNNNGGVVSNNPPSGGQHGISISCSNGVTLQNGVVFIAQFMPNETRNLYALGINGFDPVMVITEPSGNLICVDDEPMAADYEANLPTTGSIPASSTNALYAYTNTSNQAEMITIIIGDYSGRDGEFLFVINDMYFDFTANLGTYQGFEVTDNLGSVTTYATSADDGSTFDAFLRLVDDQLAPVVDSTGQWVECDDAVATTCWGQSYNMGGSFIRQRQSIAIGSGTDAVIRFVPSPSDLNKVYYFFVNNELNQSAPYNLAFHTVITTP